MRILVPTVVLLCQVHAAQASEVLLQQLETVGYQLDIGLLQMLDEVLFALEQEGGRVGRGSALQLGCGTGIYADYLKSGSRRVKRRVICVDPEPKFGVFKRKGGPRQHAVNILDPDSNTPVFREQLGKFNLVFTIMEPSYFPRDRQEEVAKFLADSLLHGGRLVFLSDLAHREDGTTMTKAEWKREFRLAGLELDDQLSAHGRTACDSFVNMKSIQVFRKTGATPRNV